MSDDRTARGDEAPSDDSAPGPEPTQPEPESSSDGDGSWTITPLTADPGEDRSVEAVIRRRRSESADG